MAKPSQFPLAINQPAPLSDHDAKLKHQFEQLFRAILAQKLTARSWKMGWMRFFGALEMDTQAGITFRLVDKHQALAHFDKGSCQMSINEKLATESGLPEQRHQAEVGVQHNKPANIIDKAVSVARN